MGPGGYKVRYYTLIDRKVVACTDLMQWAQWMELARRNDVLRIGREDIGDAMVSTVFLGLDHAFMGPGPVVFETMIFMEKGNYREEFQWRYMTLEEAEAGHKAACDWLRQHEANATETARALLAMLRSEVFERKP